MAKVKSPALSMMASGNLGDICYTRYRGTAVARSAWSGTQTATTDQLAQRAKMTLLSAAWGGTLNAGERTKWSELAKQLSFIDRVGNHYSPNGYTLFIQRNMNRLKLGLSMSNDPVEGNGAIDDSLNGVISKLSGTYIQSYCKTYQGNIIQSTAWELWKAGPFDSPGRTAIAPEYRLLTCVIGSKTYDDYAVTFCKYYWYRIRWIDKDGRVGNFHQHQICAE